MILSNTWLKQILPLKDLAGNMVTPRMITRMDITAIITQDIIITIVIITQFMIIITAHLIIIVNFGVVYVVIIAALMADTELEDIPFFQVFTDIALHIHLMEGTITVVDTITNGGVPGKVKKKGIINTSSR